VSTGPHLGKTVRLSPLWRNIPNIISSARLCATGFLLALVLLHRVETFKWLLLACLLSDIVDGLIARAFHLTSKLGAFLDSLADVATMSLAVLGVLVFQRVFVVQHSTGLLLIVGSYVAEIVASLWRYGRVSSFHTVLARVAAFMAGLRHVAIPLGLSGLALPKDCHDLHRGSLRRDVADLPVAGMAERCGWHPSFTR
jgi:phosphatidylglycerophosphate synthase